MKRTKAQKGITLIALIITVVVLLILAAVVITAITEYNIIENANSAVQKYGEQAGQEDSTLKDYSSEIDKYMGGIVGGNGSGTLKTVSEVKNVIQTTNTKVVDEYGNQIVVPEGFKIRVDEGTRIKGDEKSTATNVTQGIVIEDEVGNQFVWVPVGTIYTNVEKRESKTITLGRYSYQTYWDFELDEAVVVLNNYIPDENGVYIPVQTAESYASSLIINSYFTEDMVGNHNLEDGNIIARNICDFVTSAMQNKGYYIGRYEAGKENNTLVCKAGQEVYVDITQLDSATLCKNMYNNGADGYVTETFSSDLINSYAWDTAIIFIQTFGGEDATDYYEQNNSTWFKNTGENRDEYCNINDMSGNANEWSTETSSRTYSGWFGDINVPCVCRGGYYWEDNAEVYDYTSGRVDDNELTYNYYTSFRPILYVAL